MRKMIICIAIILIAITSKAQDISRTLGVGLQSSFPTYGLSVKYAITNESVIQGTIAPFQAGTAHINFFGGRYMYRFINENETAVVIDPYVFAGVGLITYNYGNSDVYSDYKGSFFSYSVGGGVEFIVGRKFGISAELGYGKLNVSGGEGISGIMGGGGLHYYIY